MATFYLCNNVQVGPVKYWAGRLINDVVDPAANIRNAGGLLWPSADTLVAAAAVIATKMKVKGSQPPALIADVMLSAVQNSLLSGGGIVAGVQKQTATFGFAQLTAAALTQSLPLGGLLPANARILTREFRLGTAFSGGAIATMVASLGLAPTGTEIVNAQNVFTGAPAVTKGTDGADPFELLAAASQLNVTFTSTVANVNASTAGALTVDVMYIVTP